jgi:hypothetical protein
MEECGVLKTSTPEVGAKGGYFKGSPFRESYFVVKPMYPHEAVM